MGGRNLLALCLVIVLLDLSHFQRYPQTLALSTRERRAILRDELYRWDKGIVPYIITDSVDAEGLVQIQRAMATYERFTCIRFVPYTNSTVEDYRLTHQGHLRFVKKSSCTAVLGNNRNPDGQEISCCTGTQCIHELGHSLGLVHEHQSPDRDGWVRINPHNIQSGSVKWFTQYDHATVLSEGYDMTSVMSYTEDGLAKPGAGHSMTFLFPELMATDDYFYMFKEVVDAHDCKGMWCPDSDLVCSNDGYLSVVDGQCVCRCPSGLDPSTGCSTIFKKVPNGTTFPGGQYALPMTTSGCPDPDFAEGFRRHYGDTDGNNKKTESYNLAGNVTGRLAEHYFCVTTGQVGTDDVRWTPGEYCIYRKGGACPDGFQAGLIQFIDRPSSTLANAVSGELPDGRFDKETHFEFCCRQDGFPRDYLVLPNTIPMALFQVSENCQKILGMHDIEERFGFNNVNYERAGETGMTPFSYLELDPRTFTHYTRHCYYRPADMDCGGIIHLDQDNPEVTFSSKLGAELECTWVLHAPSDSRILLNFPEFNITSATGEITGTRGDDCVDYLEVSYARIGQTGLRFCGSRLAHSIVSIFSSIKLRLLTFESSESHFKATASLVPDKELCYSVADSGASYVGDVYYTRDFKPCLNWTDVQHCPHSAFSSPDAGKSLIGNYCRNPGNGLMPWCYTEAKSCERNYCDVCGIESRYDVLEDCQARKTQGYCVTDPEALSQCALTCQDQLTPVTPPLRDLSAATCGQPPAVKDGKMTSSSKPAYGVGDTITYKCMYSDSVTEVRCLTTGQWSSVPYVCHECSEGWTYHQGNCYLYYPTKLNFTPAKKICAEQNATIAAAKTQDQNDFLDSLRMVDQRIWLGAQDVAMNGTWLWQDGEPLNWTNWKTDHPNAQWQLERCIIMTEKKLWIDFYCEYQTRTFICETSTNYVPVCADYQDNCLELLDANPSLCSDQEDFARRACRLACGFCNKTLVCEQEEPSANAILEDPNQESVPVGGRIIYTCKSGYRYVSGDAIRYCGDDGVLEGNPLVCEDWNRVVARTAAVNLKESRGNYGKFYRAYTANNRHFRIFRAGRVVSWVYFSNRPASITLQVWRAVGKGGLFTLVGQNKVPTDGGRRLIRYQVPQDQQIRVSRGDVIGIHYGGTRGGVPYKICGVKGLHVLEIRRRVKNSDTFKVGSKYRFRKRLRCAIFSFRALLGRP